MIKACKTKAKKEEKFVKLGNSPTDSDVMIWDDSKQAIVGISFEKAFDKLYQRKAKDFFKTLL